MPINKLTTRISSLPRRQKQLIMAVSDVLLLSFGLWLAFSLRVGKLFVPGAEMAWLIAAAPVIAIPIFIRFGLYHAIVRYIGLQAIWAVVQAVSLYALLWGMLAMLSGVAGLPRSVTLINWLVAIMLIGGSRMLARWWLLSRQSVPGCPDKQNVVIYGAGNSGVQLATALLYSREYRPVAYIDDNPELNHKQIQSLPVYSFAHLGSLIEHLRVSQVLLAMPSASRSRRKEIIKLLEPYHVQVKTLPGMSELADGKVSIEDIKDVDIEDLLGRDPVPARPQLVEATIRDKVVLVTGAGGSIGSELCRQIVKHGPRQLLLFEQNEYALYAIEHELARQSPGQIAGGVETRRILPLLGSVQDSPRLEQVCKTFGVQTIYHAAAYKHVPMVEMNPAEAIKNNIFGTWVAAEAAIRSGVATFVLISTDKAVRPTNIMGATKRFAELILQAISRRENLPTRFTMVRFGNVLGSSGSVIPLFRQQIRNGGPVTVTDARIIRYFMTIPEAAELVLQAGAMGQGGDVLVLDMGEPVKILDLAQRMIRLSGFDVRDETHPDGDIEIHFSGLRPGEKLYEELLIGDWVIHTEHPAILRAEEEELSWAKIETYLHALEQAVEQDDQHKIRSILLEAIKGFNPQCEIQDLVFRNISGLEAPNVRVFKGLDS